MDTLDLQDLATELETLQEEYHALPETERMDADSMTRLVDLQNFADAFRSDTGYDLEDMARNEPYAVAAEDFQEYAEELAVECGYVPDNDSNPLFRYIDWAAWARDLKLDYTSFTYQGTEYYVRSY